LMMMKIICKGVKTLRSSSRQQREREKNERKQ